jgi:hypothetical protein
MGVIASRQLYTLQKRAAGSLRKTDDLLALDSSRLLFTHNTYGYPGNSTRASLRDMSQPLAVNCHYCLH